MATKTDSTEVFVLEMKRAQLEVCVIGNSPMICNRMSEKARMELLLPKGKKNAAEKASSLKHDVMTEYRASPYISRDENSPTLIQALASMFKGAMKTAALDMPGINKSQIGRLVYVEGDRVDIYGKPELLMSVTRSADMKRTPDVRTRAILPRWACRIVINYAVPMLKQQSVINLLAAGGMTSGIGDWRIEKGSGSYGGFRICDPTDKDYLAVLKEGRKAQQAAMDEPVCYDDETENLLAWYTPELKRRGFKIVDGGITK